MLEFLRGDLLKSGASALVNAVNCRGVMGKGIAWQFRCAYPQMFDAYKKACAAGEVRLGRVHIHDLGIREGAPRWIINFPTKDHWVSDSFLGDIRAGLADLVKVINRLEITSIAVPPLGCGNGGLDWEEVLPLMTNAFSTLPPHVRVEIYVPIEASLP